MTTVPSTLKLLDAVKAFEKDIKKGEEILKDVEMKQEREFYEKGITSWSGDEDMNAWRKVRSIEKKAIKKLLTVILGRKPEYYELDHVTEEGW